MDKGRCYSLCTRGRRLRGIRSDLRSRNGILFAKMMVDKTQTEKPPLEQSSSLNDHDMKYNAVENGIELTASTTVSKLKRVIVTSLSEKVTSFSRYLCKRKHKTLLLIRRGVKKASLWCNRKVPKGFVEVIPGGEARWKYNASHSERKHFLWVDIEVLKENNAYTCINVIIRNGKQGVQDLRLLRAFYLTFALKL